ncbi:MAG: hypothetical protein Q9205_007364 [Flavoplaca limonia]
MSARISTILILGATRGIGEALAHHFHTISKKVIITGHERDEGKMQLLADELPGRASIRTAFAGASEARAATALFVTTSSLAYFPVPVYPGYCAAKAGLASFVKILRMQARALELEKDERRKRDEEAEKVGGMRIIEVVPPYVDIALNAEHRAQTDALQGGEEKAVQPMALGEYVDGFFEGFEEEEEEIAVGFAKKGVEVWKRGFGELRRCSGME